MQLDLLGLLGRIDSAKAIPHSEVAKVKSYRDAVRLCWLHRRVKGMKKNMLSELTGMYAQHITDYLCDADTDKHGKQRRDLPAKYIKEFEGVTGNTYVSQWLALQSGLTVLESMIAERKVA